MARKINRRLWQLLYGLLQGELMEVGGLMLGNCAAIACGVNPDGTGRPGSGTDSLCVTGLLKFGKHVEVAAMRAEKDVAGQGGERSEGVVEICGDAGIGGTGLGGESVGSSRNEADTGIGRPATYDDNIKRMSARMCLQRPRRAAARMASGFVRGESGAA